MDEQAMQTGVMAGIMGALALFYAFIILVFVVSLWRIFSKAGRPGWAAIIPIYNLYVLVKVCGRPGWWPLLLFIPLVNLIFAVILALDLAKAFGQHWAFGIGLLLLGIIFYPILAFGDFKYVGKAA